MPRKKKQNYVDNSELRDLLVYWIENNPFEDGSFLDKYERTMTNKGKLDKVKEWIAKRRKMYSVKKENTEEFRIKEERLFRMIYKIVEGRVSCFKFNNEEREDLIQEIMLAETKYLNRYNELLNTSAFAYISEVATNAIKLYLGNDNNSRWCRIPWNDLNDSCIAIMYGVEENQNNKEE